MTTHRLVQAACAALLVACAPPAGAQGFGSVSSAKAGAAATVEARAASPPAFSSGAAPAAVPAVVSRPEAALPAPQARDSPPPFSSSPAAAPEEVGHAAAAGAPAGVTVPFGSAGSAAPASATVAAAPRTGFEPADRVLVKKSERRLYLMRANRIIAEYPIRLGLNPSGHKQREGDFRTPEGTYQLVRRNPRSEFFLSLEVSYPNEEDRARARKMGVRPGGLIMIHGQPNVLRKSPDYYANFDWTNGCIALSNSDMAEIWLRTGLGTPVEIRP